MSKQRDSHVFEGESDWRYGGGTDVVPLNTPAITPSKRARFDLKTAVVMTIEKALEAKVTESVPVFFERIIATAASSPAAAAASDADGRRVIRRALAELVIGILPKSIQDRARQAAAFIVRDITKRSKGGG